MKFRYELAINKNKFDKFQTEQTRFNSQTRERKRLRRKADDIRRVYECREDFCDRKYGAHASLLQHVKLKHPLSFKKYLWICYKITPILKQFTLIFFVGQKLLWRYSHNLMKNWVWNGNGNCVFLSILG